MKIFHKHTVSRKISTRILFGFSLIFINVILLANSSKSFKNTIVIQILDTEKNIIYKEIHGEDGISRKLYDFSYLAPGVYKLNIKTRYKEYQQNILVKDPYSIINEIELVKDFLPAVFIHNNELFISFLNGSKENATLSIENFDGKIIYKEILKGKFSHYKTLDIGSFPGGEYKMKIVAGNHDFLDKFMIMSEQ
ncbi:MAG: DUF3244 domain-containing protein [bacterium]